MQAQVRLIPHATRRRVALKILRIIFIASRHTTGEEQPEGYPLIVLILSPASS